MMTEQQIRALVTKALDEDAPDAEAKAAAIELLTSVAVTLSTSVNRIADALEAIDARDTRIRGCGGTGPLPKG